MRAALAILATAIVAAGTSTAGLAVPSVRRDGIQQLSVGQPVWSTWICWFVDRASACNPLSGRTLYRVEIPLTYRAHPPTPGGMQAAPGRVAVVQEVVRNGTAVAWSGAAPEAGTPVSPVAGHLTFTTDGFLATIVHDQVSIDNNGDLAWVNRIRVTVGLTVATDDAGRPGVVSGGTEVPGENRDPPAIA